MADAMSQVLASAESGDQDAMVQVGLCYLNGKGVDADFAQAVMWFRRAADLNDARGMVYLGLCYGLDADFDEAVIWYQRAAALNDNLALMILLVCFERAMDDEVAHDGHRR